MLSSHIQLSGIMMIRKKEIRLYGVQFALFRIALAPQKIKGEPSGKNIENRDIILFLMQFVFLQEKILPQS